MLGSTLTIALAVAAVSSPPARPTACLMAPDPLTDRIMLFSAADGRLLDPDFISNTSTGAAMFAVAEAIVVEDEIWATDPFSDRIHRFSLDGSRLEGVIVGGFADPLDYPRGMAYINGFVYVTNWSTFKHGSAMWIARLDPQTARVTSTESVTPTQLCDLAQFGANLAATNQSGDSVQVYNTSGNPIGNLASGSGLTNPEQVFVRPDGSLLVNSFSGLYEFDASGVMVGSWFSQTNSFGKGVAELGNGTYIASNTEGVHLVDPATGQTALVLPGVRAGYFAPITVDLSLIESPGGSPAEPASVRVVPAD